MNQKLKGLNSKDTLRLNELRMPHKGLAYSLQEKNHPDSNFSGGDGKTDTVNNQSIKGRGKPQTEYSYWTLNEPHELHFTHQSIGSDRRVN